MNTAASRTAPSETSPRTKARLAGAFYLLTILLGMFAESIQGRLVVAGDPAATLGNIQANGTLLRLGYATYLVEMACQIVMTVLFYDLMKPISRSISLLAAFFSLVGITIKTFSRLFFVAPLILVGGTETMRALDPQQQQGLAHLLLQLNSRGAGMALVFFGFYALLLGTLIVRSTFLPRILGVLGILGGFGWLLFLAPPFAMRVYLFIIAIGLLGSVAKIFWLLVFGVNEDRWREQERRARESIWA